MATSRTFASGLFALALASCGGIVREDEQPGAPAALMEAEPPAPEAPKAFLKLAARSVWGVVPDPPRRKQDLQPGLIRGSAVAVAPDTLLASCRVVGQRQQVGVVRHRKYRLAQVSRPDSLDQDVCALRVGNTPLNIAAGFRGFADLREGEFVYAVVSRTSAEYGLTEGQVVGKGGPGGRVLETTLLVPPSTLSAVLFDARGNLVGLGAGGPTEDSLVLGAPLSAALAPGLAQRDLGPPLDGVAVMALQQPKRWQWIWRDEQDGDDDDPSDLIRFVAVVPVAGPGVPPDRGPIGGRPGVGPDPVDGRQVSPDLASILPNSEGPGADTGGNPDGGNSDGPDLGGGSIAGDTPPSDPDPGGGSIGGDTPSSDHGPGGGAGDRPSSGRGTRGGARDTPSSDHGPSDGVVGGDTPSSGHGPGGGVVGGDTPSSDQRSGKCVRLS
jgi:hypothetical protein